jgi:hypothetical protein
MKRARGVWFLAALLLCLAPSAHADNQDNQYGADVEVWTDKGQDAVYQPGDPLIVKVRVSDDAYLMVYEIDSEGNVRLISPEWGKRGFVKGGETFQVPSPESDMELVVSEPVGEGYIVAIAARDPFRSMPWYLRPYNAQADEMGYRGAPEDDDEGEDQGVTTDGKIVGDPFVAMERIRRRVLADPDDQESFGTAYTSYYVHHEVKYPRYVCYDCHRPHMYSWWDGFDPYYASCSVFQFRVNYAWGWGPAYWFGYVPYYYYVLRPDCPPRYAMYSSHAGGCFSSWDGRRAWNSMWGPLTRPHTAPPPGYIPPNKADGQIGQRQPPGFLAGGRTLGGRQAGWMPSGRAVTGNDGTVQPGGPAPTDGSGGRVMRGGGLQWRERNPQLGRGADPSGRAGTNTGREDGSTRDQGGSRARDGGMGWAYPRPNRPWTGDRGGRQNYDGLPEYQRPRDGQRFDGTMPRGRLGGLLDQYYRPHNGNQPWGRQRSQSRREQSAPAPSQAPPQNGAAPQRQGGGNGGGGSWGPVRGGGGGGGGGRR